MSWSAPAIGIAIVYLACAYSVYLVAITAISFVRSRLLIRRTARQSREMRKTFEQEAMQQRRNMKIYESGMLEVYDATGICRVRLGGYGERSLGAAMPAMPPFEAPKASASNCENCGAPVAAPACEYCGTTH